MNPDAARLIESGNVAGIRALMDGKIDNGCHSMNSALTALLRDRRISPEDARNVTTDRIGLLEALAGKAPRARELS
jgi:twitching motility protein PilT